jgi:hypothetical protein
MAILIAPLFGAHGREAVCNFCYMCMPLFPIANLHGAQEDGARYFVHRFCMRGPRAPLWHNGGMAELEVGAIAQLASLSAPSTSCNEANWSSVILLKLDPHYFN